MAKEVKSVLVARDQIKEMCQRLGAEITADYKDEDIVLICVLRGAVVFLADLMRYIERPCEIDFLSVSSYCGTESTGIVKIIKDLDDSIEGRNVIIVEDIIDSGLTLSHLIEMLRVRKPRSIRICTAFNKPNRRKANVKVDYIGMDIPDEFVVGYGLDYDGQYRNLPDICILGDREEK